MLLTNQKKAEDTQSSREQSSTCPHVPEESDDNEEI